MQATGSYRKRFGGRRNFGQTRVSFRRI